MSRRRTPEEREALGLLLAESGHDPSRFVAEDKDGQYVDVSTRAAWIEVLRSRTRRERQEEAEARGGAGAEED